MPRTSALARLMEESFPIGAGSEAAGPGRRLRRCLAHRDARERVAIRREIDALLRRGLCDMQLDDVIAFELGSHVRPADVGMTPSAWLEWVGRQVDDSG